MQPPCKAVLFDLDGLILDTESLCLTVAQQVLAGYGKPLTLEAHRAALGKRPLDAWTEVAKIVGLEVDPQQLLEESELLLSSQWKDARLMPGALRLIRHLGSNGVPLALTTSTPRRSFISKTETKLFLRNFFQVVVCGDEVSRGKPDPEVFQAAARQLGVPPEQCLVIEDAPSGVAGAVAAGMRVLMVPSLVHRDLADEDEKDVVGSDSHGSSSGGDVVVLPSLLAMRPEQFGLAPFHDLVHDAVPLDSVIYLKGVVVKGFGRGSKELGIPTANIDSDSLRHTLAEAVTGIYAGWASVQGVEGVHKMVMSIGWNPYFNNKEKTAEPWILHDFNEPFYGREVRLVICGYVRPEANFPSLQALVDRIHTDAVVSKNALDDPLLAKYKEDPFLAQTV